MPLMTAIPLFVQPLFGDPHGGGGEEAVVWPGGVGDEDFEHEIDAPCVTEMLRRTQSGLRRERPRINLVTTWAYRIPEPMTASVGIATEG